MTELLDIAFASNRCKCIECVGKRLGVYSTRLIISGGWGDEPGHWSGWLALAIRAVPRQAGGARNYYPISERP